MRSLDVCVAALLLLSTVACATGAGGEDSVPDATTPSDDAASSTGPALADSGPPAQIGQEPDAASETPDAAASEAAAPPAGCTAVSDCSAVENATEVAATACVDGGCVITCNGDNYDVNGVETDGCEVPDTCPTIAGTQTCPVDDHTESTATNAGSYSCDDSSSAQNISGRVPSDFRAHLPSPDGFDGVSGSAPDVYAIDATGGVCEDDISLTLTMNAPTAQRACYVLTANVTGGSAPAYSCQTGTDGTCSFSEGSGSYGDNTTIYVVVSKSDSCPAATTPDDATYTITGHL